MLNILHVTYASEHLFFKSVVCNAKFISTRKNIVNV